VRVGAVDYRVKVAEVLSERVAGGYAADTGLVDCVVHHTSSVYTA
jgi:hypothetical protein